MFVRYKITYEIDNNKYCDEGGHFIDYVTKLITDIKNDKPKNLVIKIKQVN